MRAWNNLKYRTNQILSLCCWNSYLHIYSFSVTTKNWSEKSDKILKLLTLRPTMVRWWKIEVSFNICSYAWPHLMDSKGLGVIHNAYFSLLKHTKQHLLVTFCDTTSRYEVSFWTHTQTNRQTDGQTDVEVEIVI